LLLFAKHLFIAAIVAIAAAGGSRMSNGTASALNSEQDLASIPMAQGGLSRLAIARLKSAGVPVAPLLKRVGLTPELVTRRGYKTRRGGDGLIGHHADPRRPCFT